MSSNATNWFENLDRSKIWTEYENGKRKTEYRFYEMSDDELILESMNSKKSYVKILKNDNNAVYMNGPIGSKKTRQISISGKWEKMPLFPNG